MEQHDSPDKWRKMHKLKLHFLFSRTAVSFIPYTVCQIMFWVWFIRLIRNVLWIDQTCWSGFVNLVSSKLRKKCARKKFLGNFSGNNRNESNLDNEEDAQEIISNISLHANTTDQTQLCGSFIIQDVKSRWRKRWKNYKLGLIGTHFWTQGGRLPNLLKTYFLRMAADGVIGVNKIRVKDGLSYSRKSMILCGLALRVNEKWK